MKKLFLLCIFSLYILSSCNKEDEIDPITICDSPPLWGMVNECCYLALPNVITPNGNALNDNFRVLQLSIDSSTQYIMEYNMTIKDGNSIVFETDDMLEVWDGTDNSEVVSGVFEYTISVRTNENELTTFNGELASLPNIADSDWNDDEKYFIENCETCFTENSLSGVGWIEGFTGEPELCE